MIKDIIKEFKIITENIHNNPKSYVYVKFKDDEELKIEISDTSLSNLQKAEDDIFIYHHNKKLFERQKKILNIKKSIE